MIEIKADLWNYPTDFYRCVTTNGIVMRNGELVMGAGVAKEAKLRYPKLPIDLGYMVDNFGNDAYIFDEYRIISFPTKKHWRKPSIPKLIEKSAKQIARYVNDSVCPGIIAPRVGCGLGGLLWDDVKPILEKYFIDERFIICHNQ